jgi:mannitol-specific phosphotransferase system IIBC component
LIRVVESTLTAIVYYHLGLFAAESQGVLWTIVPSVLIGIPLGAYVIRQLDAETFRRICMSFDAWVVGFGLSRVLMELKLLDSPWAYSVMVLAIMVDGYLLYVFFKRRGSSASSVLTPDARGHVRGGSA